MKRAVIYRRVSTKEQADSRLGLESQRGLVLGLVERCGLTVVGEFEDAGVSASIPLAERPEGRRMVDLLAGGGAEVVVALEQERLFRDTIDCLATIRRWHELDVRLMLVDGGEVGVDDPDGFLTVAIKAVVGEHARLQMRQRTRRALEAAREGAKTGARPGWRHGRAAFGFRNAVRLEGGRRVNAGAWEMDEREAETVRMIRDLSVRMGSHAAVARELNAMRVPTRTGAAWSRKTVRDVVMRTGA
jgi:putative DNA-invertase from lambdoid prophage Rac